MIDFPSRGSSATIRSPVSRCNLLRFAPTNNSPMEQICKRLRGPFTNKLRSAGSGWIHQLFQPRHGRGSLEGPTMTAKPIYGRVRTGLLFIDPHNDFLSEGGKLRPRVATNSQPDKGQPHKEAIMYSKNSPHRRPPAEAPSARYGIPAHVIGDGLDTWRWWVGGDKPGCWGGDTSASSKSP